MSICATIGKPIYTNFDVCIHDGFVVFDSLSENKEFIYYYLTLINKKWYRYGQSGTQVNLNSDIVSNEKIKVPQIQEQQKIADFLTQIDNKIEQLSKKKQLLETYKKGVMQQLFSQVLRFKDDNDNGNAYPDWEVKKLGELGKFIGGGTPSKSILNYWQGNIPWISSSDISGNDIHHIKITRFINDLSVKESATKLIPKNSVLFISRVGVGKLAINKKDLCTSQDFTNFIPKNLNSYYLGYFFIAKKIFYLVSIKEHLLKALLKMI